MMKLCRHSNYVSDVNVQCIYKQLAQVHQLNTVNIFISVVIS